MKSRLRSMRKSKHVESARKVKSMMKDMDKLQRSETVVVIVKIALKKHLNCSTLVTKKIIQNLLMLLGVLIEELLISNQMLLCYVTDFRKWQRKNMSRGKFTARILMRQNTCQLRKSN